MVLWLGGLLCGLLGGWVLLVFVGLGLCFLVFAVDFVGLQLVLVLGIVCFVVSC